ncbi:GntR family transcriptional regulator [Paracoccus aestuariivivens]|uniref:GntR family transcriptional regulator n=1 Tax=Paracoccus aestuariivivens TaxID=1820333 RepID=A0A6L6JA51_9RHOB|nr:GntR family transcriptional regulator [Paracoccus aestuariivivens]MTH79053.1 GntR family transcriptional regulator [Paracoccus aestuariivivens]
MRALDSATGLAEHVALALRDRIIGGALVPGQRLSEAKLAAELDISRNTLREVFRLLTRDGLLRHEPNRGVFVASPSMATILDIYRVRRLIEIPALTQAWPKHAAVDRMEAAVRIAEIAQNKPDWREVGSANMEFHTAIVALTDSPRLMDFFARIVAEMRLAFGLLGSPEELHAPYIGRNREILQLLQDGQGAKAAALLDDYLTISERNLMSAFARISRD